jgi:1-acyl-sn-glycerol-3-phosphate acyltransferase
MNSRFSRPAVTAFEAVFRPWLYRRLRAVMMAGLPRQLPADRPLLLAANHVSWFDGFVLREVQRRLRPRAPHFTLMSREELGPLSFLRLLGVVELDRSSPSSAARAIRFLERETRRRPDAAIGFFPQGRIWPANRRPLGFKRGLELFARRLDPLILPVGIHFEPMAHIAPTCFVSIGPPMEGETAVVEVERAVESELNGILDLLSRHGEDAAAHWPGIHENLGTGSGLETEPR